MATYDALTAKLDAGQYGAFINQVNAKCCVPSPGKSFTADAVARLIALANQLN